MPTINQNRIELKVIGLPAHDWTHTNTVNATTTMPAMSVRRVSGEMVRLRLTAAVMSLPPALRSQSRHSHHAIYPRTGTQTRRNRVGARQRRARVTWRRHATPCAVLASSVPLEPCGSEQIGENRTTRQSDGPSGFAAQHRTAGPARQGIASTAARIEANANGAPAWSGGTVSH